MDAVEEASQPERAALGEGATLIHLEQLGRIR
jgi:hypothetical protein